MNPDGSGQLYVPGLTEVTVQSPEDINRVSTTCWQPFISSNAAPSDDSVLQEDFLSL